MMGPKSRKFEKVELPGGVTDLFSLLNFLGNQAEVEAHLERIDEYTRKANEAVATLCKAEEVDKLLAEAKASHAEASSIIEDAKVESVKIVAKATSEAVSVIKSAQEEAEQTRIGAEIIAKEAENAQAKAFEDLAEAEKLQRENDDLARQLVDKARDLEAREAEIKRKEAVLSQL